MSFKILHRAMSQTQGDIDPLSLTLRTILIVVAVAALAHIVYKRATRGPVPISVNYHFTRKCNKECGFCFHTAKTSHVATLDEAKRGLALLKAAGMRKLNFAGGEPFLYPKYLGRSLLAWPPDLAVVEHKTLTKR